MVQPIYIQAIRQGLWRCGEVAILFAVVLPLHGQKIGEVDLTREVPMVSAQPPSPPECDGVRGGSGHTDGFILSQGERPKLELNIISLSNSKPALGEVVEAEISLKNIGKAEIVIPWATDPNLVSRPQEVTHQEYESASFWIQLKDATGREEFLRLLSVPLYASRAQPQSSLKLFPGQWVTIRIKFQFVVGGQEPSRSLASGVAELRVEWRQGYYTWQSERCNIETSYSSYESFYDQETDPVKVFLFSSKDEQARANNQQ